MNEFVELSVVMSVYNGGKDLSAAIESVLNQHFQNFEFIIVNDGSTDGSLSIIRSFPDQRIRVIDQPNQGLSRALNAGCALARGALIARMDADDICLPSRFAVQVAYMRSHPECVALGSNALYISDSGEPLYESVVETDYEKIQAALPVAPFFHSSVVMRKDAFDLAGRYPLDVPQFIEDKVLWVRMSRVGQLHNIPDLLLCYRITPNSITANKFRTVRLDVIFERIVSGHGLTLEDKCELETLRLERVSKRRLLANYHFRLGKIFIEYNFIRRKAFEHLLHALYLWPLSIKGWFNIFLLILPQPLIDRWKASRGLPPGKRPRSQGFGV